MERRDAPSTTSRPTATSAHPSGGRRFVLPVHHGRHVANVAWNSRPGPLEFHGFAIRPWRLVAWCSACGVATTGFRTPTRLRALENGRWLGSRGQLVTAVVLPKGPVAVGDRVANARSAVARGFALVSRERSPTCRGQPRSRVVRLAMRCRPTCGSAPLLASALDNRSYGNLERKRPPPGAGVCRFLADRDRRSHAARAHAASHRDFEPHRNETARPVQRGRLQLVVTNACGRAAARGAPAVPASTSAGRLNLIVAAASSAPV